MIGNLNINVNQLSWQYNFLKLVIIKASTNEDIKAPKKNIMQHGNV